MDLSNYKELEKIKDPLRIPQILNKILSFLDTKPLHSMRLVEHLWNYEASKILKNLGQRNFHTVEHVERFIYLYEATTDIPCKSVVFSSEVFDAFTSSRKCLEVMNSFGNLFGQTVTSIHVNVGKIISTSEDLGLRNIVENYLTHSFPNLSNLSILSYSFPSRFPNENFDFSSTKSLKHLRQFNLFMPGYEQTQQEYLKSFLFWMYQLCPLLEIIKCWNSTDKSFETCVRNGDNASLSKPSEYLVKSIFDSILEINNKLYLTKLQEIKMAVKLKETDLRILSHKHFVFRKCYLVIQESVQSPTFSLFIHRQRLSLETLFLEFQTKSLHSVNVDFTSSLPQLTTLTLVNYRGSAVFLNKCPSIKNLCLNNCNLDDVNMVQTNSIGALVLCKNQKERDLLTLSAFQKLRTLVIHDTDDVSLRIIFETLPFLTSLTCAGDKLTDGGVCGESNNILKFLYESAVKNAEESLKTFDTYPFKFNSTSFPSIGDLTRLQNLHINAKYITDAAILFGIHRCQLLKQLHIHSSLELITPFGFNSLVYLNNLEKVNISVRNKGWQSLTELRFQKTPEATKNTAIL